MNKIRFVDDVEANRLMEDVNFLSVALYEDRYNIPKHIGKEIGRYANIAIIANPDYNYDVAGSIKDILKICGFDNILKYMK